MLDRYKDFINQQISDNRDQKLLLAVSGGVDSMVMLDLSIKANLSIAVAHVNHGMRGSDSDADEILVRDICAEYGIVFHSYSLNANVKSLKNFQGRARDVRYRWWNELCDVEGYSYILTAHHSTDSVETFLLNLTRGSGIRGLSSIPSVNQNILRPLSGFTKNQVLAYADLHHIGYREDNSNQESKYKRNEIRNKWIPFLRSSDPNIEKAISKSIANLTKEQALLNSLVLDIISKNSVINKYGYQLIRLNELINNYNIDMSQLLYQYFSGYGFTEDNCKKCLTAKVGSEFHSETHDLLKDRGNIILRRKNEFKPLELEVNDFGVYQIDSNTQLHVNKDFSQEGLVVNGLQFPFTVRHKRAGDSFCPSGMQGATQKLKDFLTNAKLDKWSKQNTLVVEHNSTIVAILPFRVAYGYNENSNNSKVNISIHYC